MLDRIQELLAARELSASQFADAIGVSRPVVSHLLSGRNKPSLEVVQKVLATFPDVSVSWLLNGDGPMYARPTPVAPVAALTSPTPKPTPPPVAQPAPLPTPPPIPQPAARIEATSPPVEPARAVNYVPTQAGAVGPRETVYLPIDASAREVSTGTPPGLRPHPAPLPAAAAMAAALAEPGKAIRRIVLFYQDGTFADFRPEAAPEQL